ncbi:hypothetical protein [Escherichia phage vB_EcoM_JNE01]|jgi:hypothetical protein|uniref:Uncharacterized protein n=1 Tax=Escherichia phage fEgEco12 TaxID=3158837 RepID=A0AAU7PGM2_9CAUD|nr:hypothetical protein [Escherichia coli]MED6562284.1 hypothetical protein [Escherichia coli O157]WOL23070.1 hypothetical protein [Escherichia phage vB_EcoM_JNE01]EGE5776568.1 hypothetical protein [Escherichia coli]MDI1114246.1 hypothetical protein [Escherichia coli]MED6573007.1 hypothetical protein [Escherichia coli O157]
MNPTGLNYKSCSAFTKANKANARKAKVQEYIKQGMTRKAAILKAKNK